MPKASRANGAQGEGLGKGRIVEEVTETYPGNNLKNKKVS